MVKGMIDLTEQTFTLGKTKSSPKWHIVVGKGRSRCGHQIVGNLITNVPFDKLMAHGELCSVCHGSIMFDAVRGPDTRWDLRRFSARDRAVIRRLRA